MRMDAGQDHVYSYNSYERVDYRNIRAWYMSDSIFMFADRSILGWDPSFAPDFERFEFVRL